MEHFLVLGLQPGSSNKEIKDAYRKLAMQFHPDRTGGSSYAEARFKEINAAYKALTSRASARRPAMHQEAKKEHQTSDFRRDRHSHSAHRDAPKAGPDYSGFLAGLQAINKRFDEVDAEIQKAKASFGRFDRLIERANQAWKGTENREPDKIAEIIKRCDASAERTRKALLDADQKFEQIEKKSKALLARQSAELASAKVSEFARKHAESIAKCMAHLEQANAAISKTVATRSVAA